MFFLASHSTIGIHTPHVVTKTCHFVGAFSKVFPLQSDGPLKAMIATCIYLP